MPERPPCPICRRPLPPPPAGSPRRSRFCSERCRQVDLGRWLSGNYAIPASEADEDENPAR